MLHTRYLTASSSEFIFLKFDDRKVPFHILRRKTVDVEQQILYFTIEMQ
jgi:hypothetical protein